MISRTTSAAILRTSFTPRSTLSHRRPRWRFATISRSPFYLSPGETQTSGSWRCETVKCSAEPLISLSKEVSRYGHVPQDSSPWSTSGGRILMLLIGRGFGGFNKLPQRRRSRSRRWWPFSSRTSGGLRLPHQDAGGPLRHVPGPELRRGFGEPLPLMPDSKPNHLSLTIPRLAIAVFKARM